MGATHSSTPKVLGSLNRFPQLQKNLKRLYRNLHPNKSAAQRARFVKSLTNETRIRTVIEGFEKKVFGHVKGGNDLIARVDSMLRKLNLKKDVQLYGETASVPTNTELPLTPTTPLENPDC